MGTRKLLVAIALIIVGGFGIASAQAPQGFNYQGIARDAGGAVLADQNLTIRIGIIDGGTNTPQYVETHQATTNPFGLFTVQVGQGNRVSGSFAAVTWADGNKLMQTEIDLGAGFTDLGTSPLMSVPYALVAGTTAVAPEISLEALTNVDANAPTAGQTLKWNGTSWVADDDLAGFELPYLGMGQSTALTPLFEIRQADAGPVAKFVHNSAVTSASALIVESAGPGETIEAMKSNNSGSVASFLISSDRNPDAALKSLTRGSGNAGHFQIINANSDSAAVFATTNGTAPGLLGQSTANGIAYGVYGVANGDCVADNTGLRRFCPAGVYGTARRGPGVYGYNTGIGAGVQGYSENGRIFEGWGPTVNPGFPGMRFYVNNQGKLYAEQGIYTNDVHSSSRSAVAELIAPGDTAAGSGDVMVVNENGAYLQCSDSAQSTVIGVVVANPAFLAGNELDDEGAQSVNFDQLRALAVSGIVTINVTVENGDIAPGDLLVTSPTAGHAMKAAENTGQGTVVAKALEGFAGPDPGSIKAIVMLR